MQLRTLLHTRLIESRAPLRARSGSYASTCTVYGHKSWIGWLAARMHETHSEDKEIMLKFVLLLPFC